MFKKSFAENIIIKLFYTQARELDVKLDFLSTFVLFRALSYLCNPLPWSKPFLEIPYTWTQTKPKKNLKFANNKLEKMNFNFTKTFKTPTKKGRSWKEKNPINKNNLSMFTRM